MTCRDGGFTLTEVMMAVAVSTVVVLALYQVDQVRVRVSQRVLNSRSDLEIAFSHVVGELTQSDAVDLANPPSPNTDTVTYRTYNCPTPADPTCFTAGNDQAHQYRWMSASQELYWYQDAVACTGRTFLGGGITAFAVVPSPSGAQNQWQVTISAQDNPSMPVRTLTTEVTLRVTGDPSVPPFTSVAPGQCP